MTNLKKVFSETKGLHCEIDRILKLSIYDEYDDLSGLEIDYKDGEQLFLLGELQSIMESLNKVKREACVSGAPGQGREQAALEVFGEV